MKECTKKPKEAEIDHSTLPPFREREPKAPNETKPGSVYPRREG